MANLAVMDVFMLTLALLAAGVATGLLSGLFGIGGGTVIVPVLYAVFSVLDVPETVRMHLCVGTSLAIITPTSVQSFRTHLAKGKVLADVLRVWAIPVVLGVVLGGVVAAYASSTVLRAVFVVIIGANALKLLWGSDGFTLGTQLPGKGVLRVYGAFIGLASSLIGIGGGIISNLLLTLYSTPIHVAVATSSGLGVLIALPGAIAYMLAGWSQQAVLPAFSVGYVSLLGFALIAPTATFVAPYGARLAHRWPKRRLEVAFAVFLLVVVGRFAGSLIWG